MVQVPECSTEEDMLELVRGLRWQCRRLSASVENLQAEDPAELDEGAWRARLGGTRALQREITRCVHRLRRGLDDSRLPQDMRESIRAETRMSRELLEEISSLYGELADQTQEAMQETRRRLTEVGGAGRALRTYRAGAGTGAG